ncbi:hypothetical protein BJV77DRAFT_141300 [Russula vinacea]|nr:hypothetical protein BJV77DRAFT_141300 [Russula vinacea]
MKQASDCNTVLVHDTDLVMIDGIAHGTLLENLEPDVTMDLLRRSNIEIHKVLCDLALSNSPSSSNTDMASVKVAMLEMTFQSWNTASPSQLSSAPVVLNIDNSGSRRTLTSLVPSSLTVPTFRGITNAFGISAGKWPNFLSSSSHTSLPFRAHNMHLIYTGTDFPYQLF